MIVRYNSILKHTCVRRGVQRGVLRNECVSKEALLGVETYKKAHSDECVVQSMTAACGPYAKIVESTAIAVACCTEVLF